MKKYLKFLILFFVLGAALNSCYNDNEYDLYPYTACDSTSSTYSGTIVSIMAANCNTCHSAALANGNVVTENYQGLQIIAANGKLKGVTNWLPGYVHMPLNSLQLPQCDLAKINFWINAGFPNN
ncbi:MAG: hypothetical protein ACM3N9_06190 [Syntrophothermus sp.]